MLRVNIVQVYLSITQSTLHFTHRLPFGQRMYSVHEDQTSRWPIAIGISLCPSFVFQCACLQLNAFTFILYYINTTALVFTIMRYVASVKKKDLNGMTIDLLEL